MPPPRSPPRARSRKANSFTKSGNASSRTFLFAGGSPNHAVERGAHASRVRCSASRRTPSFHHFSPTKWLTGYVPARPCHRPASPFVNSCSLVSIRGSTALFRLQPVPAAAPRVVPTRSAWLATGAWNNPERLNVRTLLRLAFSTAALRHPPRKLPNPNGVASSSPGLPSPRGYPGYRD